MNSYETTYCAFYGNGGSLLDSRSQKGNTPFFTMPVSYGPLWGFREQTLPGLPGPQWTAEAVEHIEEERSPSVPPTTYKESYQFRRRNFDVLNYDAGEHANLLPSLSHEEKGRNMCGVSTSQSATTVGNPLYDMRCKTDRRHDSLSQPHTSKGDCGAVHQPHLFETSSRVIGKFSESPQTIEHLFASQTQEERKRVTKQQREHRAGLNAFEDSLRAYRPKLEAYKNELSVAQ